MKLHNSWKEGFTEEIDKVNYGYPSQTVDERLKGAQQFANRLIKSLKKEIMSGGEIGNKIREDIINDVKNLKYKNE